MGLTQVFEFNQFRFARNAKTLEISRDFKSGDLKGCYLPSSCTKKDAAAKSLEVSTTSGLFCAQFLKSEKKISKRVLAKSMDLYLYPRHFEPLFREFFGKAALFYSRQNVEFEQAFLLVLLDRHSECMCHCVDTGKAQNTLQCLGGTL